VDAVPRPFFKGEKMTITINDPIAYIVFFLSGAMFILMCLGFRSWLKNEEDIDTTYIERKIKRRLGDY